MFTLTNPFINITLSNLMPVFVWLKLLPFHFNFFFFFNLLGVAFASVVSIAGNKLNILGTEALSGEKFYSSMCDKRTFLSLIVLLKLNLKPLCACTMGDMRDFQHMI